MFELDCLACARSVGPHNPESRCCECGENGCSFCRPVASNGMCPRCEARALVASPILDRPYILDLPYRTPGELVAVAFLRGARELVAAARARLSRD